MATNLKIKWNKHRGKVRDSIKCADKEEKYNDFLGVIPALLYLKWHRKHSCINVNKYLDWNFCDWKPKQTKGVPQQYDLQICITLVECMVISHLKRQPTDCKNENYNCNQLDNPFLVLHCFWATSANWALKFIKYDGTCIWWKTYSMLTEYAKNAS